MHETTEKYINKDNISFLINEFIREVRYTYGNDIEMNILIVGGSALALKYGYRATVDIDTEIRTRINITKCINDTAKRLNIPKDFVNEDFMKSHSYSRNLWDNAILVNSTGNVRVFVVSDLDQLCMKIISGRPKDVEDARVLTDATIANGIRFSDVLDRFDYLYVGMEKPNMKLLASVRSNFKRARAL